MIRAVVHHRLPGRMRLRAEPLCGRMALLRRIEQDLSALPGVNVVTGNAATGSLLIEFDIAVQSEAMLLDRLCHVYDITAEDINVQVSAPSATVRDPVKMPRLAHALQTPFDRANQSLLDLTNGYLDLRYSLPVVFVVAGTWKVLKYTGQPAIPWYMYYWMAFNLFSMFRVMAETEATEMRGVPYGAGSVAEASG